ncbi:RAM signaling network component [Ascosphaera acerosa]|nr:RAM signaling network component [Ascosphaera acerosa]
MPSPAETGSGEQRTFEKIVVQLQLATDAALQAVPVVSSLVDEREQHEREREIEYHREHAHEHSHDCVDEDGNEDVDGNEQEHSAGGAADTINAIAIWSRLAYRCQSCLDTSRILRKRLGSALVSELAAPSPPDTAAAAPDPRTDRSFWQLCRAFLQTFVELLLDMREAKTLQLLSADVATIIRPVQRACREAGRLIDGSPWSHMLENSPAGAGAGASLSGPTHARSGSMSLSRGAGTSTGIGMGIVHASAESIARPPFSNYPGASHSATASGTTPPFPPYPPAKDTYKHVGPGSLASPTSSHHAWMSPSPSVGSGLIGGGGGSGAASSSAQIASRPPTPLASSYPSIAFDTSAPLPPVPSSAQGLPLGHPHGPAGNTGVSLYDRPLPPDPPTQLEQQQHQYRSVSATGVPPSHHQDAPPGQIAAFTLLRR